MQEINPDPRVVDIVSELWNPDSSLLLLHIKRDKYMLYTGFYNQEDYTKLPITTLTIDLYDLKFALKRFTQVLKGSTLHLEPGVELYGNAGKFWSAQDTWYLGTEIIETNNLDVIKLTECLPRILELLRL